MVTLLTWPGSAIVHDIKGENWTLIAGWRARYGRVLTFDPTNAQSAACNPYWSCVAVSGRCATSKTSPTCWLIPKARWKSESIGEKTSNSPQFGTILHVLYAEPDKTLAGGRICDLVESARLTTLYLVVPPSDISRTKPLVRLILNHIGRRLTEDLNAKGKQHRLLLMLDEFPALGRLHPKRPATWSQMAVSGRSPIACSPPVNRHFQFTFHLGYPIWSRRAFW